MSAYIFQFDELKDLWDWEEKVTLKILPTGFSNRKTAGPAAELGLAVSGSSQGLEQQETLGLGCHSPDWVPVPRKLSRGFGHPGHLGT